MQSLPRTARARLNGQLEDMAMLVTQLKASVAHEVHDGITNNS